MQIGQKLIPGKIDFDSNPLDIPADTSYFMKGIQIDWENNTVAGGNNSGNLKPQESNYLYCSIQLPKLGSNTVIGYYYFAEAIEGYVIVHNTQGQHLIYRLEGKTGQCKIVYRFCQGLLGITADPLDFFSEGRIAMKSLCRFLPDGTRELYKEMLLVNKKVPNLRIVIEDSIATNSFTTPFFTPKNLCCGDACRLIKVGVPTPMDDIIITPITSTAADANIQNLILNKMIKVRFKHENAWGQQSEHGKISPPYIVNIASCSTDAANLPHCLWFTTKVPCPEILRVIIEVQTCQLIGDTGTIDGGLFSDWKQYAVIELYDQTDPLLKYYERQYKVNNGEFEIFNNEIRYKFCNNKECKIIARTDIRDANPAPINSGTVVASGKGLLYADNENYYNPLKEVDKQGISFLVETASVDCFVKRSRIVVYAVIHNVFDDQNNPVWQYGTRVGFGGFAPDAYNDIELLTMADEPTSFNEDGGYGQFFPDGVKGFRGILAGTNFRATSTQQFWTPQGGFQDYTFSTELQLVKDFMNTVRTGKKVLIQKFDFGLVPNGKYIFRIMGHAEPETIDLENTSTYYYGNYGWDSYKTDYLPGGGAYSPQLLQNRDNEILIDTTSGNGYDSLAIDVIAVIADMTQPSKNDGNGKGSKVVKGYLYEDKISKQPIELAELPTYPFTAITSQNTDHNGFFFMGRGGQQISVNVTLFGFYKCASNVQLAQTVQKQKEGTSSTVLYASDNYPDYATSACNHWWVSGKVKECGTNSGIAGVAVILGRTKPVYTNSSGDFRVIAHLEISRLADILIFSNSGNCEITNCNCGPIGDIAVITQPTCFNCGQGNVLVGQFNFKTIVNKGFEHGSRVPIGIVAHDWLGRHTDVQDMSGWEVQIPSEQQLRSPAYPRIKVNLPFNFSNEFCRNFKHLTFFTGNNPDYSDYLTWAADKVEFVDSAGNVSTNGTSKIKIWYRSLGEYNRIKGLNTNTTWNIADAVIDSDKRQILDKDNMPIYRNTVADLVEFIQNADGSYIRPGVFSTVEYDKDGSYFLIDYDVSLSGLRDGVKFKFKRPYACEQNHPYYEYSFTLYFCNQDCKPRDANGNIVNFFYLDGYNAYMLPRQIPVVTDVPATETLPATKLVTAKTYPFLFEHHSPSNSWGDHCFSGGRISYKNPYEGKKCNTDQILPTGAINAVNDGAINYLHYFDLGLAYYLGEEGSGPITALISKDAQTVMAVCENTTYVIGYNDERVIVTNDGYIQASIPNRFSRPKKDDGFAFGCQVKDLNTLRRNGSLVMWLDSIKVAVVVHDFSTGQDISKGIKSWLTASIKKALPDRSIYFHGNFNNRGRDIKYILTKFDRRLDQFVNNEDDKNVDLNETIGYSLANKNWEQMFHYTPEYFGNMYGDITDTQFFSFKNGMPYAHHNALNPPNKYLNFFGLQCIPYIGVVANVENTKVKSYTGVEVYCFNQMFICEKIETQMGQKSKILEGDFVFGEGFWQAAFLCDTQYQNADLPTGANAIIDGDMLYGTWLKALFQPEPGYTGGFFELVAFIIRIFPREKSSI